ncbi:GNAT family N-acetyltransferase [Daejeonella sp.]|uniref:GNAT family N-acetyltransferase n=1 Tax=Daejeonella sp. TaxID=2805397 RepID=UPI0030C1F626
MKENEFVVVPATEQHTNYAEQICDEMAESAKARGTGIARRTPDYIIQKMLEGKAVIALHEDGTWAGFCYIETWSHGTFVANSGLIVNPQYRNRGLAKLIKKSVFDLSRQKYPDAKIFGLTTGLPVMKINSELGYEPVTYSMLTQDEDFWKGCQSCVNYDILKMKERKNCMCTAMLWDPEEKAKEIEQKMKEAEENKKKANEERLSKVSRKQTLLERIEETLRNSLKMIATMSIAIVNFYIIK